MVSVVVTLYAERSPDWLAAVIEQRHRLRPRRHNVGLRVGHGTVVTSPPPKKMIMITWLPDGYSQIFR